MSRRNIELVLLLVAAPVVALLFAMIAINEGQQVNVDSLSVPIGIFAAFVVAHLAVRKLAPGADPALLPMAFGLSGIGIASSRASRRSRTRPTWRKARWSGCSWALPA